MKPDKIKITIKLIDKIAYVYPDEIESGLNESGELLIGYYIEDGFVEIKESYEEVSKLMQESLDKFNKYIFDDRNYYRDIKER